LRAKRPKLSLTEEEKRTLRKMKIKLSDFHRLKIEDITDSIAVSTERAKILKGLATFQQVPSIGYELASKLVIHLGYFSLDQIKTNLELKLRCWTDSCVEDQILCIIHYANHPESEKQWFDFTAERKLYRQQNGYPVS
jgi:hypothetical protein